MQWGDSYFDECLVFNFACSEVFLIVSLVLEQCKYTSHHHNDQQQQKEKHLEKYFNKVVSRRGYAMTCKSS